MTIGLGRRQQRRTGMQQQPAWLIALMLALLAAMGARQIGRAHV